MSSENASTTPGYYADASENSEAAMPSSEPGQDAAGLPDGSGTDLPDDKAPKDRDSDDAETFDAG